MVGSVKSGVNQSVWGKRGEGGRERGWERKRDRRRERERETEGERQRETEG